MKIPTLDDCMLIKAKTWDSDAINYMIKIFNPRLNALINSFYYRTSDMRQECIQSAYICLLNCCRKYDKNISKNFFGFVMVCMKNSIINCLRQETIQTTKICVNSSSYYQYNAVKSLEFNHNLEDDVLEEVHLEKLNADMENGYYSMRDVKLFKAICRSNFDFKTYAKDNDILISTLYKNILRLREKIKIRLSSPNAGNGTKFEPHKIIPIRNETLDKKE